MLKTPRRARTIPSTQSSARALAVMLVLTALAHAPNTPRATAQTPAPLLPSQPQLTAQAQCTDIDLTRPGSSMHCQPIYNQSLPASTVPDASLCYAIAATEVWDAYRWNERRTTTADCATFETTSPVHAAALYTLTNPSERQELAWGFEHITFNALAFHGGCRARALQSNPSDVWAAAAYALIGDPSLALGYLENPSDSCPTETAHTPISDTEWARTLSELCDLPSARVPTLADTPTMTAHHTTRTNSRSNIIHRQLERGLPAAIVHGSGLADAAASFESEEPGVLWQNEQWQQTASYGVNHATVIVARAWRGGECQFRIRDSYGQNTHTLGEFWVRESLLADWLARVGEVQN